MKRGMAGIAERSILLVDSSKLGARAPIRFGTLAMVDTVITDSGATEEQLELLSQVGVATSSSRRQSEGTGHCHAAAGARTAV